MNGTIIFFLIFYWCFAALYFIGLIDLRSSNWTGILLACVLSGIVLPYSLGLDARERQLRKITQDNVKK